MNTVKCRVIKAFGMYPAGFIIHATKGVADVYKLRNLVEIVSEPEEKPQKRRGRPPKT